MSSAEAIISGLGGNPYSGRCRCPAHDDRNPSLHVTTGNNGKVLIHCFAGCAPEAVIEALKTRGLWSHHQSRRSNNLPSDFEDQAMQVDQPTAATKRIDDEELLERKRGAHSILNAALYADVDHAACLVPYLKGRGFRIAAKDVPQSLMYLPVAQSRELQKSIPGFLPYPAMIAPLVNHDDQIQGVHVAWLTMDSHRNLRDPQTRKSIRKTWGRLKGGFIGLGRFDNAEQPILVAAEGIEKAMAAMRLLGQFCPAIAVPGGNFEGVTPPGYPPQLIIAADNDAPGLTKAEKGAAAWAAGGRSVSIAAPTDVKDWDDAVRAAKNGAEYDALQQQLLHAELVKPGATLVGAVSAKDFMAFEFPPREYLLEPWLTTGSLAMIHAFRGVGKTWLGLSTACAVASGNDLLGWKVRRRARTLYVDGELSGDQLQRRLQALGGPHDDLFILTRHWLQVQGKQLPDLGTAEGRAYLDREIERNNIELIILDSISTLVQSGVENEAESWAPIVPWQLKHRFKQRAIVYLHHESREGKPRGTSKREDAFDSMIRLKSCAEQSNDHETAFELSYTKSRDFAGTDAAPKTVYLSMADGLVNWRYEAAKAAKREQIVERLRQGDKQAAIAKQLGVDRSYVSRIASQTATQRDGRSGANGLLTG